jgi:hypothetical protein
VQVVETPARPVTASGVPEPDHRRPSRGRRAMVIIVAFAFVAVAGAALVVTLRNSGTGRGHLTVSLPSAANSDIRVDLQHGHLSLRGHTNASGSVTFDTTVQPGRYDVVVTVDRKATSPVAGSVDIGTARVVYRVRDFRIEEGRNTLRSHQLE